VILQTFSVALKLPFKLQYFLSFWVYHVNHAHIRCVFVWNNTPVGRFNQINLRLLRTCIKLFMKILLSAHIVKILQHQNKKKWILKSSFKKAKVYSVCFNKLTSSCCHQNLLAEKTWNFCQLQFQSQFSANPIHCNFKEINAHISPSTRNIHVMWV